LVTSAGVRSSVTRLREPAAEFGEHIEVLDVSPPIFWPDGAVAVDAVAVPRRTTPPVS
jgi:hypothetical protein